MNISQQLQVKTQPFRGKNNISSKLCSKKSDFHSLTRGFLTINFSRSQPVLVPHMICMGILSRNTRLVLLYSCSKQLKFVLKPMAQIFVRTNSKLHSRNHFFGKQAELQKFGHATMFWNAWSPTQIKCFSMKTRIPNINLCCWPYIPLIDVVQENSNGSCPQWHELEYHVKWSIVKINLLACLLVVCITWNSPHKFSVEFTSPSLLLLLFLSFFLFLFFILQADRQWNHQPLLMQIILASMRHH